MEVFLVEESQDYKKNTSYETLCKLHLLKDLLDEIILNLREISFLSNRNDDKENIIEDLKKKMNEINDLINHHSK